RWLVPISLRDSSLKRPARVKTLASISATYFRRRDDSLWRWPIKGTLMSIRPPIRSRLIFGLGGCALVLLVLFLTEYGIFYQHDPPIVSGIAGLVLAGIFALIAWWGARSSWVRADDETVGFYPSLGKAIVFPRSRFASVVRVRASRGGPQIEFRAADGTVLFIADASFGRSDVERFARFLKVPCAWDL